MTLLLQRRGTYDCNRRFHKLVLVPGFEPGSTDRESDMMDRTTPHERHPMGRPSLFQNVAFHNTTKIFTFTFTFGSIGPVNMAMARHRAMIIRQNRYTGIRYRKRPDPHQVVPLSSLKMTDTVPRHSNEDSIVTHSGVFAHNQSWLPMRRVPAAVEVSPRGWTGLHRRMISSKPIKVEVS